MPGLKDLLKKKDKIAQDDQPVHAATLNVPEFKIIRSTTESEEVIQPPSDPEDDNIPSNLQSPKSREKSKERRHHLGFRKSSNADITKDPTAERQLPIRPKDERRFSGRLHFHRPSTSRSTSAESSVIIPQDLPDAPAAVGPRGLDGADVQEQKEVNQQREAQWEKRATILAQSNPLLEQQERHQELLEQQRQATERKRARSRSPAGSISDRRGDDDIQEAIRLHEIGELKLSTDMFGRLGDPKGANNALAQVLYGLALRHGWGVAVEPEKAIHYLSLAASNSALVEKMALENGMKKGGAAC